MPATSTTPRYRLSLLAMAACLGAAGAWALLAGPGSGLQEWLAHPASWLATLGAPGLLVGLWLKQGGNLSTLPPPAVSTTSNTDEHNSVALARLTAVAEAIADGEAHGGDTLSDLPAAYRPLAAALVRAEHHLGQLHRGQSAAAKLPGAYGDCARRIAELYPLAKSTERIAAALADTLASGDFRQAPSTGASPLEDRLAELFAMIDQALRDINVMTDNLARGKLTAPIRDDYPGQLGTACAGLNRATLNLRETIGRIETVVDAVAGEAKQIAVGNSALATRTQEQAANLEETASSMEELNAVVQQNAESAASVMDFVDQATTMAENSSHEMTETSRAIAQLADSSRRIEDIVTVIDSLAFQTNILALNAAVEAARAGEHGRGFAVVASEVRQLSHRSAEAAQDIRRLIAGTAQQTAATVARVDRQSACMSELIETVRRINGHMRDIRSASQEQASGLSQVSQAIMRIDDATQQTSTLVDDAAASTRQLYGQARGLNRLVAEFDLGAAGEQARAIHREMPGIVQAAAAAVAKAWESALRDRRISEADLFDERYEPFGDTDPPKYHTAFDALADSLLPAIQEAVLAGRPQLSYAIACDHNGYVPTHNDRYCEPLTGDPTYDKLHNRTKRLFSDPVGERCGRHPLPYLLQTYRRDTGEIVHDISAPVMINGRHWGGFRIGYKTAEF